MDVGVGVGVGVDVDVHRLSTAATTFAMVASSYSQASSPCTMENDCSAAGTVTAPTELSHAAINAFNVPSFRLGLLVRRGI